jgi:hypothetical protein
MKAMTIWKQWQYESYYMFSVLPEYYGISSHSTYASRYVFYLGIPKLNRSNRKRVAGVIIH